MSNILTAVLDTDGAAAYLGVSKHFLIKDRRTRRLVPHVPIGDRILYRICDLDDFLEQAVVREVATRKIDPGAECNPTAHHSSRRGRPTKVEQVARCAKS
jgi:hypothetical protein